MAGRISTNRIARAAKIAQSLAQTGVFGNPYKLPTGPTAHSAPAFPFLLSLVYRVFGEGHGGELAKEILSTSVASLQYALLPLASISLGLPIRVGMLGGLVGALFPFRFWLETKGSLEQVYVALALLLAIIATGRAWRSHDEHIGSSVWRGYLGDCDSLLSIPASRLFASARR